MPYRSLDFGALFAYLAEEELKFGEAVQYGTADGKVKKLVSGGQFAGIVVYDSIPQTLTVPPTQTVPVNGVARVAKRGGYWVPILKDVSAGAAAAFLIDASGNRGFVPSTYTPDQGETLISLNGRVVFENTVSYADGALAKVEINLP